jgi:hypothetical protein
VGRNCNVGVQAHTALSDTARGQLGGSIGSALPYLTQFNEIARSLPGLARFWARDDTRTDGGGHQGREQGIVSSEWVVVVFETALFENPHHTTGCSSHHSGYIFGFGRGKWEEGAWVVGGPGKDSVKYEAVEMRREI